MSLQSVLSQLGPVASFLNEKLSPVVQYIKQKLSLGADSLPEQLQTPLNFSALLVSLLLAVLLFANDFICNLVGAVYPAIHSFNLLRDENQDAPPREQLVLLNKYWAVYGFLVLVDLFLGFVLHLVPGFFYLKLLLLYSLVRNDFAHSERAFALLAQAHNMLNLEKWLAFAAGAIRKCIRHLLELGQAGAGQKKSE